MFMPIYADTPAARLVDWLEFQTLIHKFCEIQVDVLWEAVGLAEDAPVDAFLEEDPIDVAVDKSEDTQREQVYARVEQEVERRMYALADAYPFHMEDGVLRYYLDRNNAGQLTYLLCLRLSLPLSGVIDEDKLPPITIAKERNLFQHCANLAAAGYLGGKVYAFGWPRLDQTSLLDALRKVENAMGGEGVVKSNISMKSLTHKKDGEIDVIAWIPHADGPGGALTLWGQVASGKDWEKKELSTGCIEQFRHRWYEVAPSLDPVIAMFLPFSLFEKEYDNNKNDYQELIRDRTKRYGILFHRYRLPAYVQRAIRISKGEDVSVMESLPGSEVLRLLDEWWEAFYNDLYHAAEAV